MKNFIATPYSMPHAAKSKLNLHFVEFFWGTMKRHQRDIYCATSKNIPDAMASVDVLTIRKWEHPRRLRFRCRSLAAANSRVHCSNI
jgi:hypothetical protein